MAYFTEVKTLDPDLHAILRTEIPKLLDELERTTDSPKLKRSLAMAIIEFKGGMA